MSLTQGEKKEDEKERSEVEGRDERKRQTGRRKERGERRQEGISIHKPLGGSVVTSTTVTGRQVQVLIRILEFY